MSCDWGTTSFRIRLADRQNKQILREITNHNGSTYVYDKWKENGSESQKHRVRFYLGYIQQHIDIFSKILDEDLSSVPIVISVLGPVLQWYCESGLTTIEITMNSPGDQHILMTRFKEEDILSPNYDESI